eukprot:2587252-Alexandrium_andersonii.AAC.1
MGEASEPAGTGGNGPEEEHACARTVPSTCSEECTPCCSHCALTTRNCSSDMLSRRANLEPGDSELWVGLLSPDAPLQPEDTLTGTGEGAGG